MNRIILTLASLLFYWCALAQENDFADDQLVIKFKPEISLNVLNCVNTQKFGIGALDELNTKSGLLSVQLTGNKKNGDTYLLKFNGKRDVMNLVDLYDNTGLFGYVEPNFRGHGAGRQGIQMTPNDLYFSRQYALVNNGSFSLSPAIADADIDMDLAWDIEQGDSSIVVAVLDAGLKLDHPEFNGRIWANPNDPVNGADDDLNSYIDDFQGWDFANNDNDPTDDHGHGTNVTGIVGANGNNLTGYAGVDWNCKLMICKILDQNNNGVYSWWADAIYYAVDNGASILNMSVGGSNPSNLLKNAIAYANNNGVTVVACMMNENNSVTYYPAGYASTIAVGATNPNDERTDPFFWSATSGSCYGNHIDVVAPGNYMYGLSYLSNNNYATYWGGTSQATPLVSGLCALLLAQNPGRTPSDLRNIIRSSAEDMVGKPNEDTQGFDVYHGYGRVNAYEALKGVNVGVNEFKAPSLSVYPNPATSSFVVKVESGFRSLQLSNSIGQVFHTKTIHGSTGQYVVDSSTLPAGLYLLSVWDNNQQLIGIERVLVR